MTYQEALAYLEQASSFGIKPGLERITALMEALGNPQEDYKIVHVTGTNGKGVGYLIYFLRTVYKWTTGGAIYIASPSILYGANSNQ